MKACVTHQKFLISVCHNNIHPVKLDCPTMIANFEKEGRKYVVLPEEQYKELVENQIIESGEESMTLQQIEALTGKPERFSSWVDGFLLAESLQETLAGVLGTYAVLGMKEGQATSPDPERLRQLEERGLYFAAKRDEYAFYNLKEKQNLLIELYQEQARLRGLRSGS